MSDRRRQAAQRRGERERNVGLDADDEAARWLAENEPAKPEPPRPKRASKSKALHQWRERSRRGDV
jgi:hypothetical protein